MDSDECRIRSITHQRYSPAADLLCAIFPCLPVSARAFLYSSYFLSISISPQVSLSRDSARQPALFPLKPANKLSHFKSVAKRCCNVHTVAACHTTRQRNLLQIRPFVVLADRSVIRRILRYLNLLILPTPAAPRRLFRNTADLFVFNCEPERIDHGVLKTVILKKTTDNRK